MGNVGAWRARLLGVHPASRTTSSLVTVNELPGASGSHVASSSRLGNPEMGEGADCYLEMYV